jgi:NTE family protein
MRDIHETETSPASLARIFEFSLVLGGGNALGAYHLGVCERLSDLELIPRRLFGVSIGAITAAILAGNRPEHRLEKLQEFWNHAAQWGGPWPDCTPNAVQARQSNAYALNALTFGRPGLFMARFPGLWSLLPGIPPDRALHDHAPLARTLEQLIDFDLLNRADTALSIVALDLESGEEVWFDNFKGGGIQPTHLLASTAFAPLLSPVEVDGRLLCDAGFANNLPINRAFAEQADQAHLCIAVDLFSLDHGQPKTIDETIARVQDLTFASQTRRAVEALARERELLRKLDPNSPPAILAHLAFRAPGHQRGLKALDYSQASIEERIKQGRAAIDALLPRLARVPRDRALAYLRPVHLHR